MNDVHAIYKVKPTLVERKCGGWLAVSPRGWPLVIGVTAQSKADAEKNFTEEMQRFSKIQVKPS